MKKEQKIIYKKITEIKPYKNNAKKHNKEQIEKIAESIKEFGFRGAVLIDSNNVVVAGHGRTLAAKKAGLKEIPCIYVDDLTEEQIKALRLADNKLNESEWDFDILFDELKVLSFDIDMTLFGFGVDEEETKKKKKVEFEAIEGSDKIKTEHKCPRCGYEW